MGHPRRNSAVTVATRLTAETIEDAMESTVLLNGGHTVRIQTEGRKCWKYGSGRGFGDGHEPLRSRGNRYMPLNIILLLAADALY